MAHAMAVTIGKRAAERLNSARRRRRSELAGQTAAIGNSSSTTTARFAAELRGTDATRYVMCQFDPKLSTLVTTPLALPQSTPSKRNRPADFGKHSIPQR